MSVMPRFERDFAEDESGLRVRPRILRLELLEEGRALIVAPPRCTVAPVTKMVDIVLAFELFESIKNGCKVGFKRLISCVLFWRRTTDSLKMRVTLTR